MREILYGRNAIYECLRAGRRRVWKLLVAEAAQEKGTLSQALTLAAQKQIPVQRVPRAQLDAVSGGHQGVMAEVEDYPYIELDDFASADQPAGRPPLFLVLDLVQDPQNLGTLLRTAEAVGVTAVIVARDRAANVTPAVVNASSGATEHLAIARVTNIARTCHDLKEANIWVAGLEDVPQAQEYNRADLRGPLALVVGSEGQGIRRLVLETCDILIKLPMRGKISSLNASVAGSIVLYEILAQRSKM